MKNDFDFISLNNSIRDLALNCKNAIISSEDNKFAQFTIEMLMYAKFISNDLYNKLHNIIINTCFDLDANLNRDFISKNFYNHTTKYCKQFLN